MPRFFIDTFDEFVCLDEEGLDLVDQASARRLAQRTLAEMLQTEGDRLMPVELRAIVRNERGASVIVATLRMDVAEMY